MASKISNMFIRMPPLRFSDTVTLGSSLSSGEDHQFSYWFGWNTPGTFYQIPSINPSAEYTATNAADYADDPDNGISKYRIMMLSRLYADTVSQKTLRRRNIAYTLGPEALNDTTKATIFSKGWAIWSDPAPSAKIKLAHIADDGSGYESGWGPGGTTIDYATVYPIYDSVVSGYKPNLTGCFDLSAQPVLAWEKNVNTIQLLRVVEGLQEFTGYSPILFCNASYVDPDTTAVQTDAVVFYLKDEQGTPQEMWPYGTLYRAEDEDGTWQIDDTRRSTAIYFRVQRNNFEIEYKMCDLATAAQHLDHVIYNGFITKENDYSGVYPWGTVVQSSPYPTMFRQLLGIIDGNGNRSIAASEPYFTGWRYISRTAEPESFAASVSLVSGYLQDISVTASAGSETFTTSSLLLGGSIEDMTVSGSATESFSTTISISGSITDMIIPGSATETFSTTVALQSGSLSTTVVSRGPYSDSFSTSAALVGGALTTE